jgi:dipicolinate synthase subunit A
LKNNKWLFIGTDKRLSACSEIMSERGFDCMHIGVNSCTDKVEDALADFRPNHIVFPILEMEGKIPVNRLKEGTCLYTGIASEEWLSPYKTEKFRIHNYLQDELFIWRNARLTAEAFVLEYYSRMENPLTERRFYVAGFGRVGKMVAHVLTSLGANVTILARADTQLGEAAALGHQFELLTDNFELKEGCLVNTIPAQWLSAPKDIKLPIFDLASAPGCLKDSSAPEYYTILPGLPGKHFPIDAATALADVLERMYRK